MASSAQSKKAPSWPSLYDPSVEILHIQHRLPVQPDGHYLYHASDVFRFTLYWTLIFYTPIFLVCGVYAFWNYTFPPSPRVQLRDTPYPLSPLLGVQPQPALKTSTTKLPKPKERRSRFTFAVLVLLTFLVFSVAGAVVGSAIVGFTITGLYRSANFTMSTWIPFLLAVIQVVLGLLSVWPSIIDII